MQKFNNVQAMKRVRYLTYYKKLQQLEEGQEFTASEVGINCQFLLYEIFCPVVGQEEVWYQINEDTMKKGCRNIYKFNGFNDRDAWESRRLENIVKEEIKQAKLFLEFCKDLGVDI